MALEDDDIEALDTLDVDLFPIFEEEALELLPQLSGALRQWSARPDNLGARQEVLRVLHTLKGSARLAGAMRLGEMAHRMESAVEQIDGETAQSAQLDPLMGRLDGLTACFEALRVMPVAALVLPEAAQSLSALLASTPTTGPAAQSDARLDEPTVSVSLAPVSSVASMSPLLPLRRAAGQTIRVKSLLIDRMVNQAGEVMITRSRLESRLGQLRGRWTNSLAIWSVCGTSCGTLNCSQSPRCSPGWRRPKTRRKVLIRLSLTGLLGCRNSPA